VERARHTIGEVLAASVQHGVEDLREDLRLRYGDPCWTNCSTNSSAVMRRYSIRRPQAAAISATASSNRISRSGDLVDLAGMAVLGEGHHHVGDVLGVDERLAHLGRRQGHRPRL
jgi:hypothetical protein